MSPGRNCTLSPLHGAMTEDNESESHPDTDYVNYNNSLSDGCVWVGVWTRKDYKLMELTMTRVFSSVLNRAGH